MNKKMTRIFFFAVLCAALMVSCRSQRNTRATQTPGSQISAETPAPAGTTAVPDAPVPTGTTAVPEAPAPTGMPAAPEATNSLETPRTQPEATPEPPESGSGDDSPVAPPEILRGIGLIGASTLDEYRGTENRGGRFADVTFNMAEMLVLLRDFNLGEWGTWDEPRRTGYAYNWARSGATSRSMIEKGQHTGVAEQVARGDVTFVFILIGANDFNPYFGNSYAQIYEGGMSDRALQAKIDEAIADVTLAVDTVLQAGAMGVGVSLFPNWDFEPGVMSNFPDADRRQRVNGAIAQINAGISAMAAKRDLILVDPNALAQTILTEVDDDGYINFGGERIDFVNVGNDPHYARLGDQVGHAGTVLSGIMANYYFIEPLNAAYNTSIPPLTPEEILSAAGLGD